MTWSMERMSRPRAARSVARSTLESVALNLAAIGGQESNERE
jgi:hypothetical protein